MFRSRIRRAARAVCVAAMFVIRPVGRGDLWKHANVSVAVCSELSLYRNQGSSQICWTHLLEVLAGAPPREARILKRTSHRRAADLMAAMRSKADPSRRLNDCRSEREPRRARKPPAHACASCGCTLTGDWLSQGLAAQPGTTLTVRRRNDVSASTGGPVQRAFPSVNFPPIADELRFESKRLAPLVT